MNAAPGSLADWLSYIERIHPKEVELGLNRVRAVKNALGLDQTFPIITVGGTNGKGSVCAMLEAILHDAGYRVGCYTSPHLLRYNERVRIGKREAPDGDLMRAFAAVDAARKGIAGRSAEQETRVRGRNREGTQAAEAAAAGAGGGLSETVPLTYFEFGTLAAIWLFIELGVEVGVLEVGLGGRLDAVNVFDADCAVVVSVDLDHMDYLGGDREAIGFEKAGIFRGHRPAVCADSEPPASLKRHAVEIGARLFAMGADFGYTKQGHGWHYWGPRGKHGALPYPALRGAAQLANASAAITALETLRERLPVATNDLRSGLLQADVPGRFQVLPGRPAVILDVAHNPHAARELAGNLQSLKPAGRTLAVFSMLSDKDIAGVIEAVKPHIDHWFIAGIASPRGASVQLLEAQLAAAGISTAVTCCADVGAAYAQACDRAAESDRILVFGSFFTVAEIMRLRTQRSVSKPSAQAPEKT